MANSAYTVSSAGITGLKPDGSSVLLPISGRAVGTQIPLGASESFSTDWINIDNYIGVATTLFSDQLGSYTLEYSEDGTNIGQMPPITVQYTQVNQTRKGSFSPSARWVRFKYTNGSTAQTKFIFNIDLNDTQTQASSETLNAVGADTRMATWTKARIETKDSDTGTYAPVYRTGKSLNVNDPDIGNLTDPAIIDPTASASVISLLKGQIARLSPSNAVVTSPTLTQNASSTLLASNPIREGATIFSESGTIFIKLGATASATSYTTRIVTNSYYEVPYGYNGIITAFVTNAGNIVRVTEVS